MKHDPQRKSVNEHLVRAAVETIPDADLPEIPGFEVHREIARGAMGRVLVAHDLTLDREVALKIMLSGHEATEAKLRFIRESKITAKLPHPGIPPVHSLGTLADGRPYLAMKLIRGETFAHLLRDRLEPTQFLQVFESIWFIRPERISFYEGLRFSV
jgi:serine/threonine protein kinase